MKPIQKIIEFFIRRKWLGILLILGLACGVGISTFYRGAISPKQRTDLTVYLKAGERIAEGRAHDIYQVTNIRGWHYVYSPLLAILLAPVSKWPLDATVSLAYLLSLACLAGTVLLSRRFPEDARAAPWQIALAMIFCLPMILNTFTRGQFGIITLFFMAAIFFNYLARHKILTGLLLALAVALKISPLAFLVFFFLMKREWKILASTALGFFLFLFLFPSLAIGFQQNWELLKIWKHLMLISQSATAYQHYLWGELFTPFAEDNQSLYAVLTRFAWPSEAQFAGHSNALVRFITSGFGVFLLALPFVKGRKISPVPAQDPLRSLAEFSLFPMIMLFTSPVTQIHHYTVVYFLCLAALMMMDHIPQGSWSRRYLAVSLWICALSLVLGMIIPILGYWGIPLWGSLLLWSAVLYTTHFLPPVVSSKNAGE
ncbi:MAG: glycosyltransferase family 87 protein [Candidatus Omnitrophica bacterium]|nr:glycosyltransferase family 87 protein [Candidatus Omnitrophota bacterium]